MHKVDYAKLNVAQKMNLLCHQFGICSHNIALEKETFSDVYFIKVLNRAFKRLPEAGQRFINCFYLFENKHASWFDNMSQKEKDYLDRRYTRLFVKYVEEIYDTYH